MAADPARWHWVFAAFALGSTVALWLFAYNSGYGYDQLEYLNIGRYLADGEPLYRYIPSKSFGIYLLIAGLMQLGLEMHHGSLAAVIALVYLMIVTATYVVVGRVLDRITGLASAVLVGLCAVFMELNFLQPTGLVYLCGTGAYWFTLRACDRQSVRNLCWAGLWLSAGFHFKSVAAFYAVGIVLFWGVWSLQQRLSWRQMVYPPLALSCGFGIGVGLPWIWFAVGGWGREFWTWTIEFPLFHYPGHTLYLHKLYTKLLWFHAFLAIAVVLTAATSRRRLLFGRPAVLLAFCLGLVSYAALLKQQASHHAFPGAAFFSIFIAATFTETARDWFGRSAAGRRWLLVSGVGAAGMILLAGVLYRPQALRRLVELRAYQEERELAEWLQDHCSTQERMLCVRHGTRLYWLAERRPAVPFLNFDVQTTYYLRRHPRVLLESLQDPRLELVEFNPAATGIEDSEYTKDTKLQGLVQQFGEQLGQSFARVPDSPAPYVFWTRLPAQQP